MKKIAIIIGIMSFSVAHAQQDSTLNRTVIVENEYNPTVMDASKINVMPKMNEPKATKKNINYATSLCPVSVWDYQVMSSVVRDWETEGAYRGCLHAGYGNYGNVDLGVGYMWDISKKDRLNVSASLDGWKGDLNGWNWQEQDWSGKKWTSRLYNTKAGLDYSHAFKKVNFLLGSDFHSRVLNYMYQEKRQRQTFGNAYVGVASTDENMPIQFEVQAGIRYYSEKYPRMDNMDDLETETNVFVTGDVRKSLSGESGLGVGVNFDNYNHTATWADEVMAIEFNPYYSMQNDTWKVRIGAHLDWIGREASLSDNDENKFYLSPDVNVEYLFMNSYILYGKMAGGRQISGFYELMNVAPFLNITRFAPAYMTLDAAVGLKASPANGWWFHVGGGYQIRENDVCLYTRNISGFEMDNLAGDTEVLYATAELKKDYKDLFDFSLKATYYHWGWEGRLSLEGGSDQGLIGEALSLKPELEIIGEVGFKPMEALRMNVGYEYVKRNEDLHAPINNLYLAADYTLLKNLSVYGRVNNLLNKEYMRIDAYPDQKLNFLAGLSFQF